MSQDPSCRNFCHENYRCSITSHAWWCTKKNQKKTLLPNINSDICTIFVYKLWRQTGTSVYWWARDKPQYGGTRRTPKQRQTCCLVGDGRKRRGASRIRQVERVWQPHRTSVPSRLFVVSLLTLLQNPEPTGKRGTSRSSLLPLLFSLSVICAFFCASMGISVTWFQLAGGFPPLCRLPFLSLTLLSIFAPSYLSLPPLPGNKSQSVYNPSGTVHNSSGTAHTSIYIRQCNGLASLIWGTAVSPSVYPTVWLPGLRTC